MRVSILGCGWLGTPLAEHLIKRNHHVKGSTTSPEKINLLQKKSIEPYLVRLSPALEDPETAQPFWDTDILIINIPPGRSRENVHNYHRRQIKSIVDAISDSSVKQVIFVSSTSVFPSTPGKVTETDTIPGKAVRDSGNALLEAETMLMKSENFNTTVVRFGGLYGGDRHPAKYMAGRKNLGKADAPVNLIHRDDCIAIITQIMEEKITGEVFNAVADAHPTRKEYYSNAAKKLGLEPPTFAEDDTGNDYKVVSNEKLKKMLGYQFIHHDLKLQ